MKTVPVAPALTVVFVRAAFQGLDSGATRAKVSRSQIGSETVGTDKAGHSPEETVRVSGGSASTYPTCDAASALRLTHPRQQDHASFCNRSARKLLQKLVW